MHYSYKIGDFKSPKHEDRLFSD